MTNQQALDVAWAAFVDAKHKLPSCFPKDHLQEAIKAYEAAQLMIGPEHEAAPDRGLVHSIKTGDEAKKSWDQLTSVMGDHPKITLFGGQQIEKINDLEVFVFNDGERSWLIVSAEGAMMGQRTVIDPLITAPIITETPSDTARIKPWDSDSNSKPIQTES